MPLGYVLRPNAEVSAAALEASYPTMQKDLFETSRLAGPQFVTDNARVWGLLKSRLADSAFWTFIRGFDAAQDGRGAYEALTQQMEGPAVIQQRKDTAHNTLQYAVYTGKNNGYTIEDYILAHLEAHQELLEFERAVDEDLKVMQFLAGLKDERLKPAICAIRVNLTYFEDFTGIIQHIRRAVYLTSNDESGATAAAGSRARKRTKKFRVSNRA